MRPPVHARAASALDTVGSTSAVETRLVDLGFPCHLVCRGCDRVPERARAFHQARRGILASLRTRRPAVLRLAFFGGDPFALPQSFTELLGEATEEADAQGITLESVAMSDGTSWSLDLVRRFASLGLATYHVGVDGPRALHDRERPSRTGGSFDRILNSLRWHRDAARVAVRVDAARAPTELDELRSTFEAEGLLTGPNPITLTFGPRRTCRRHAAELFAGSRPDAGVPR